MSISSSVLKCTYHFRLVHGGLIVVLGTFLCVTDSQSQQVSGGVSLCLGQYRCSIYILYEDATESESRKREVLQ